MKCVVNLYSEFGKFRESVFDLNEEIVEKLDEIAIKQNTSTEELIIDLIESFIEGVDDGWINFIIKRYFRNYRKRR